MLAVHKIERCHQTADTLLNGGFKWRQIIVKHILTAHVNRVVISSSFDRSVKGKMFYTSHKRRITLHVISLVSANISTSHYAAKIRILTGTFSYASPSGITTNIDHRAVIPIHTVCGCLYRRYFSHSLNSCTIPRTRQSQRYRKNCFVAMNYISSNKQWNCMWSSFDCQMLKSGDFFNSFYIEESAYFAGNNQAIKFRTFYRPGNYITSNRKVELS